MRKSLTAYWMALVAAVMVLSGCNAPIPVSEVLQQPLGASVYTKYNLWYTDPGAISSLNIQEGRILHVGSEVTVVSADEDRLVIEDQNRQLYVIDLDPGMLMCSMREYIRNFLTLEKPDDMLKDVRKEFLPYVRRGEVITGMNRQDVLFAYGPPPACRTPDIKNETWIYWIAPEKTIRVIFRNDKVRNLLNANE